MNDLAATNYEDRIIAELKAKHVLIECLLRTDRRYVLRPGAVCNWATPRDDAILEFEKLVIRLKETGSSAASRYSKMLDTFPARGR